MIIRRILHSIRQKLMFRETGGASTVEYGLLIMLVALIAILAVSTLGTTISSLFGQIDSQIEVADNNSGDGVDTDPPVADEEEEGPIYYPLTNTAEDPTYYTWRTANPGYEFVANEGIYTEEPIVSMARMFQNGSINDPDLASWDVSSVTDMTYMFRGATDFNQDLTDWETSSVTDMSLMFFMATNFNGDISGWDTSSVTTMLNMFRLTDDFNGDISSWNTSSVENMSQMFRDAISFNRDISGWDTSSVTDMTLNP